MIGVGAHDAGFVEHGIVVGVNQHKFHAHHRTTTAPHIEGKI